MDTVTAEPTTVGEMLREEFMRPMGITPQRLAEEMGFSCRMLERVLGNKRRLSVDEAWRLSEILQIGDTFWLDLQAAHDRWEARMMTLAKEKGTRGTLLQ